MSSSHWEKKKKKETLGRLWMKPIFNYEDLIFSGSFCSPEEDFSQRQFRMGTQLIIL